MIYSNLKPCCYKCNTPQIETDRTEGAVYYDKERGLCRDIYYTIYCEHACVCKHYLTDQSKE
jgi:hypothetical protein